MLACPLRCHAPPSAQQGQAAGGCRRAAGRRTRPGLRAVNAPRELQVESGRRPAAPAARSRPADPVGSGGRRRVGACGPEPVNGMRSRRWHSGSVGPPGPARGCPELVKTALRVLVDIGACVSQHRACLWAIRPGNTRAGASQPGRAAGASESIRREVAAVCAPAAAGQPPPAAAARSSRVKSRQPSPPGRLRV
jgi:hypothetical protein